MCVGELGAQRGGGRPIGGDRRCTAMAGCCPSRSSRLTCLVDVVANGADALKSPQAYRPDLIALDLMLPVMHGREFIERYRGVTHGQEIPIMVVSAAGAVTRSMEILGVRRFLPKPF
jgi:DNA-binding response OmpR family regulator